MNYKQTQEDEIAVMMSIFADEFEIVSNHRGEVKGNHYAHVNLPENFPIKWTNDTGEKSAFSVQFLPPIELSFRIPELYPVKSAPLFSITCEWLNDIQKNDLRFKMTEIWNQDRDVILYKWACFLKNDSLNFLGIEEGIDLSARFGKCLNDGGVLTVIESMKKLRVRSENISDSNKGNICEITKNCTETQTYYSLSKENTEDYSQKTQPRLIRLIEDYNKIRKQDVFNKQLFICNICFITIAGFKCIQFQPCKHVFCKFCVKKYCEVLIKEGNIQNITCPEDNCKSRILHFQIKELVSSELFKLYDEALLNVALTSMSDITICPIPSCQQYVLYDPNDNPASCSVCQYAFCIDCKMGYHGIEPCSVKGVDKKKIVQDYCSATEKDKLNMEKKHGRKALQNLVSDVLSQEWIDANSKPCPGCKIKIEKRNGCNKMQCKRCITQFCWLCGRVMNINPYNHFFSQSSPCNGLLFDDSSQ